MTAQSAPQAYLVTPPDFDVKTFPPSLAAVLDGTAVACVRLDLATRDEDRLVRMVDACYQVTSARDVALVITDHVALARRLGLDGVHLTGPRGVREARQVLGPDSIVGAGCGASRHDGMTAAEMGADYVAFGPVGGAALGDAPIVSRELFAWWSEMIEIPVVAELGLDEEVISALWDCTDFLAFGEEVWQHEAPARRLAALMRG